MSEDESMSQARPNRKERRKANAIAKKTKPLARPGVPIITTTVAVVLDTPAGPKTQFYWFASEQPEEMTAQEIIETQELHGPFDTEAEAQEAARIAVIGPDCEVTEGGMWDPAWEKPQ